MSHAEQGRRLRPSSRWSSSRPFHGSIDAKMHTDDRDDASMPGPPLRLDQPRMLSPAVVRPRYAISARRSSMTHTAPLPPRWRPTVFLAPWSTSGADAWCVPALGRGGRARERDLDGRSKPGCRSVARRSHHRRRPATRPRRIARDEPAAAGWRERWIVAQCGMRAAVDVLFPADPTHGGISPTLVRRYAP